MGKRTSYEPGTFSWIELSTSDPDAAKGFYGELFGWEADDQELPGDGGVYSMMQIDGENVAAIMKQRDDQAAAGVPPNWFSYITVANVDEAAPRAAELGGAVHAEPFDVMDAGRMAVIADPTGAMFGAWEARGSIGATLVNDPGCLTFNELSTTDVDKAQGFYSGLFGWTFDKLEAEGLPPYWGIGHEGAAKARNGGMRELAPEQTDAGVPPHWMPYFTVNSVDETVDAATAKGGGVLAPAFDIPTGARIAVLHDPQGAAFAIFQGEVDD